MKKYLFLLLIFFSFTQAFAQENEEDDDENMYEIPEGQILKLYNHDEEGKIYFFNPIGFDKASLIYFRYLALKDPRVIDVQSNKGTRVVSILVTNNFKLDKLKIHVKAIKEEIDFLLGNYDDHILEMERLIYEGG